MHGHKAMPGDVRPSLPQVGAAMGDVGATSGDWAELIWEQEVADSNPAIPTVFRIRCPLAGAILAAGYCRSTSVGVAQRLRTLAPTSPPN
jgi:hypothetical protein